MIIGIILIIIGLITIGVMTPFASTLANNLVNMMAANGYYVYPLYKYHEFYQELIYGMGVIIILGVLVFIYYKIEMVRWFK